MKLVSALILVTALSAYGKTRVVNNNSNNTSNACTTAAYTTISSAVTAANPGDTIDVCPGTYPEAVYINKPNLKLIGISSNNSNLVELLPTAGISIADVNPNAENPTVSVVLLVDSVSGVEISNISVNGSLATTTCGSGNAGIYFRNASGWIVNSAIAYVGLNADGTVTGCQEGHGIYVDSYNGGAASLTVTGSSVHDYDKSGIDASGPGTYLVAKGNAVTGAGPTTATAQNGVEILYGAQAIVNNNAITANDYTPNSSSGTAILFFEAGDDDQANDNMISDANNGVYFYLTNHATANGNILSKMFNYGALNTYQSAYIQFEKNTIYRSGLETDSGAIELCGAKNIVESNTINEAPIGIVDDHTSADGCSGATGNTIAKNTFYNIGEEIQELTDTPVAAQLHTKQVRTLARAKVSPSK